MNDSGRMVKFIVISLAAAAVAVLIVYLAGCQIEEHFWVKGMKQAEWQALFLKVVGINGILIAITNIAWTVISHTTPETTDGVRNNPIATWQILLAISIASSIAVPFGLSFGGFIPHIHIVNIVMETVVFVMAYYFTTIFATPEKFACVPWGAASFRL